MSRARQIVVISICGAMSACAPLQQAPLVYSSKVVVGLDVSANVAENQGGSINIGVKSIDSAYVPVGVSKTLDDRSGPSEKTVEIKLIEARYGEGSSGEGSDEATNAERTRKIDDYFAAKQAADTAVSQLTNAENQVSAQSTLITQLESLRNGIAAAGNVPANSLVSASVPVAADPRAEALKMRAGEVLKLNADRGLSITPLTVSAGGDFNVDQVLADIDARTRELKTSKASGESQLAGLKTQRTITAEKANQTKAEAIRVAGLSQTNKTDAMSVYGRFDTNGSGETTEGKANLLVGKVFSTGLASQNLTEAVKLEAKSRCLAGGFEFAKNMPDADRKTFFDNLSKVCMTLQAASKNK